MSMGWGTFPMGREVQGAQTPTLGLSSGRLFGHRQFPITSLCSLSPSEKRAGCSLASGAGGWLTGTPTQDTLTGCTPAGVGRAQACGS